MLTKLLDKPLKSFYFLNEALTCWRARGGKRVVVEGDERERV